MDVGNQLRRAREARGLSLETVAATTRIQPRVLDGIERNDVSIIPPQPYARGFVAAYAREIGLNPDQMVRDYFGQFDEPAAPLAGDPLLDQQARSSRRGPTIAIIAGTVLAVAAVMMVWRPEAGSPPVHETVGTTGTIAPAAAGVSPAGDRATRPAPVAAAAPSLLAREEIVAVLKTERAAWIAATSDGERVLYQIVQPGTIETLRARREITIRVGDAGAVQLSVNGAPAAPMGRSGQVRDVTLTAGAVR